MLTPSGCRPRRRSTPDNYFRMGFHAINPDAIAQGVEVLRGQLEQMG